MAEDARREHEESQAAAGDVDAAPLARLLANREFPSLDQARQALDQAILALDPCLPYTLELQDA